MSAPMGRNDAMPQIKSIFNRNKNITTQQTRFKFMKVLVWGDRTVTFCYCFVKCIQGNSISVGIIDFLLLDGFTDEDVQKEGGEKKKKPDSFSFFSPKIHHGLNLPLRPSMFACVGCDFALPSTRKNNICFDVKLKLYQGQTLENDGL